MMPTSAASMAVPTLDQVHRVLATMPARTDVETRNRALIALALLFDSIGAGAPFWWLAGLSLELLIGLAHWVADRPGAVSLLPADPFRAPPITCCGWHSPPWVRSC